MSEAPKFRILATAPAAAHPAALHHQNFQSAPPKIPRGRAG